MSIFQSRRSAAALVLLAVLLGASAAAAEEKVAFNVESRKYHCLSCRHAMSCTKNCIEITLSEAKRRGGVPCKVCGGSCSRLHAGSRGTAPNNSFERTTGLRPVAAQFMIR
jgi:hypothetical protein